MESIKSTKELTEEYIMQSSQFTVFELLQKAVQREIESQRLYSSLSERVTFPGARYAFNVLYQQEQGHQAILERYLKGGLTQGALDIRNVVDYHIAEYLDQPEINAEMQLPDIFLLAAKREINANRFYISLAALHPKGEVRTLLEKLASEELGHKNKVEQMYSEVAFPQTDGG
jgi:rubrerythrin